ncbi:uncharacterized protein LOC123003654 isoform X5 [Tribolium madens]|uniref:uncharacterized protein LOC123003654 isoform X5 n=1 Tax=Tribolium madens TaxID=41895 RepID=UPI001CF7441A|nr:uncharacterized protein LOC123003654 isoform X5 [Tribolium madens]
MNSLFFFFFFLFYCSSEDGYCFYENNPTKYFEHGSPLTAEQVEQSFGNTCSLLPRYTPLEFTFSNNEENVYLKLKNITGTTFHLYESKFPDFPNYKISISKGSMVTIAKCEEINFCELLEECSDAFIEIQRYRHQSPLPDDIVYISWKKVVSTLSILVEYEGKITRCRDFTKTINITKVVMQSDKKMPVAYTQYISVLSTQTEKNSTIISTTDDPLLLLNMTTSKIPPNNSEECSCINNYLAAIAGAGFIIVVLLFYIFWSKLTRSSRRGFPL